MIEANEVNSTFYALRLLSHGLNTSQVEVIDGEEYPASEFTRKEQEEGLAILHNIETLEALSIDQLSADQVRFYLTLLADTIERTANSDLVKAGYTVDPTAIRPYPPQIKITSLKAQEGRWPWETKAGKLALTSKYGWQFLAGKSDALDTRLDLMLRFCQMTDKAENLGNEQLQLIEGIRTSESDLLSLIDQILDLSKIKSGMMGIEISEVSVDQVAAQLEWRFKQRARDKNLKFLIERAETVAPTIRTDDMRLRQILINLLSNAFKFTKEGRVVLRIAPAAEGETYHLESLNHAEEVVAFSVSDTGIGIPADKQQIIFEAFQPDEEAKGRRYASLGLGLSLSYELVRLLGGEIRVVSTPGEGSTFTLYLPRN